VATRPEETRDIAALPADPALRMVSRNRGSGTRVLIDALLGGRRPPGYAVEPRSHHAVAAAVAQGRADWGVTIEPVARQAGLRFRPLQDERYDLVVPADRWERAAVRALRALLEPASPLRAELARLGFPPADA
jgi:putative molybdopterin biosynthesis protein